MESNNMINENTSLRESLGNSQALQGAKPGKPHTLITRVGLPRSVCTIHPSSKRDTRQLLVAIVGESRARDYQLLETDLLTLSVYKSQRLIMQEAYVIIDGDKWESVQVHEATRLVYILARCRATPNVISLHVYDWQEGDDISPEHLATRTPIKHWHGLDR